MLLLLLLLLSAWIYGVNDGCGYFWNTIWISWVGGWLIDQSYNIIRVTREPWHLEFIFIFSIIEKRLRDYDIYIIWYICSWFTWGLSGISLKFSWFMNIVLNYSSSIIVLYISSLLPQLNYCIHWSVPIFSSSTPLPSDFRFRIQSFEKPPKSAQFSTAEEPPWTLAAAEVPHIYV